MKSIDTTPVPVKVFIDETSTAELIFVSFLLNLIFNHILLSVIFCQNI